MVAGQASLTSPSVCRESSGLQATELDLGRSHFAVLIDDSIDKAAAEPYNLIKVDEYTGISAQDENTTLLHVIAYLERIRWYGNVSAEIRAAPFVVPKP
jgi:hypothetical protein